MSKPVNISIIGAGSAQFSLNLVKDLCLTDNLADSQICFMDTNPARLETIYKLACRYAEQMGANLRFRHTTNQLESLQGADFVINTAYMKGHYHEEKMREVVARHGYYHDGVSLGDFFQLRLALEIAINMEKICPEAWLIQSANPVFVCSTLIQRQTTIKSVGLCHGHLGAMEIAETLGLSKDEITFQAVGFNHNIWLTHFHFRGADAYPLIDEWIKNQAEEYWATHTASNTHDIQMSRAAVQNYLMYGLFPVGDTSRRGGGSSCATAARAEWWYHTDIKTKKHWFGEPWGGPDTELGRPYFVKGLESRIQAINRMANDPQANLVEALGRTKSDEQIIPMIDGLINDSQGIYQVNILNQGALTGIPDNVVVELPALVSVQGIQPIQIGVLPPKILYNCLLPHWLEMERNLLAFETGDQSVLLWNALDSQQTRSYEQAVAVVDDLLAIDGNQDMARHFSYPPHWK
jgi:alpha-galactosidase